LNMGWYKPGGSQEEFAQDQFACMNGSQMQVSTSNVNGRGPTYFGDGSTTCNTYGSTTNCSSGGGYSQPGYVSGSSASYTTTNMPLFQACMRAHGYVWTNQAEVERYEANQQAQRDTAEQAQRDRATQAERARQEAESVARHREQAAAGVVGLRAAAAAAGISNERYAAAQARCRAVSGDDEPLCNELDAHDVIQSEALATKHKLASGQTPEASQQPQPQAYASSQTSARSESCTAAQIRSGDCK
jgi:hypothetical protein